jgi:hypothetical protein
MPLLGICLSKRCAKRKQEVKLARIDAKTERVEIRQGSKTDRVYLRTEAKKVAYANGIDPTKNTLDGIANIGHSVAGVLGAAKGNDVYNTPFGSASVTQDNMPIIIVGVIVLLKVLKIF